MSDQPDAAKGVDDCSSAPEESDLRQQTTTAAEDASNGVAVSTEGDTSKVDEGEGGSQEAGGVKRGDSADVHVEKQPNATHQTEGSEAVEEEDIVKGGFSKRRGLGQRVIVEEEEGDDDQKFSACLPPASQSEDNVYRAQEGPRGDSVQAAVGGGGGGLKGEERRVARGSSKGDTSPPLGRAKVSSRRSSSGSSSASSSGESDSRSGANGSSRSSSGGRSSHSSSSSSGGSSSSSGSSGSSSDDGSGNASSGKRRLSGGRGVAVKVGGKRSPQKKGQRSPLRATAVKKRKVVRGSAPSSRATPKSGNRKLHKSVKGDDSSDDTGSEKEPNEAAPVKRAPADPKTKMVSQVLSRWWYCLPPWPPEDFCYEKALAERKLKWVALEDWEDLDEMDTDGFTKVYQVSHYPGVFRDPTGKAIDVRPVEGKPCFSELKKKSEEELAALLVKGLSKQLEELNFSPFWDTEKENMDKIKLKLKKSLADAKETWEKLRRRKEYLQQRRQPNNHTPLEHKNE